MFLRIATATALSLCIAGLAFAGDEDEAKSMAIGDKAPPVEIEHWIKGVKMDQRGAFEPVTKFGDGKVYVLEFWATWCGPCIAGMPHLSELQEQYRDYGVSIIGVSNESLPKVVDFLFKTNKADGKVQNERMHYTVATDPDQSVWNDYFRAAGQKGIPCAFIIGKEGHVEWIGHPMNMDKPLAAVVHDEWERDSFKTERAKSKMIEEKWNVYSQAKKTGDWKTVAGHLEEIIKAGWENEMMLNDVAWTIATEMDKTQRDLKLAMKAAMRANELSESKNPAILDTVARVFYEQGDMRNAIKWQKKAVEHAGDDQMGDEIRKTLKMYEQETGREV